MIINNIPNLKIHKLTQEQYDRARELGQLDENAFYLTPEDDNTNNTPSQPSAQCELPKVTVDDNGAFLRVVDGVWQVVKLADAEGVEF